MKKPTTSRPPAASQLTLITSDGRSPLTPEQKRFNTLVHQIETARQSAATWQAKIAEYEQVHAEQLAPIEDSLTQAQRTWVFALDGLCDQPGWSPSETRTLGELIVETAGYLLEAEPDDTELRALFAKHAGAEFDPGPQDAPPSEPEVDDTVPVDAPPPRQDAQAQHARQSQRDIFRKLASALHPDREADPQARAAKTALMQKVNRAHAANDLLSLLDLQVQVQQLDAAELARADAPRLQSYNKLLGEQLTRLRREVSEVEVNFRFTFGLPPEVKLKPDQLGLAIERQRRELQADLNLVTRELRLFDDPAATKRWLKTQRRAAQRAGFDFRFD